MGNSQEKPDFKELSKGTNYNVKELKNFYSKFIKDFPDGIMNKAQFTALYQKLFVAEANASQEFCEHVFKRYDCDGNGFIDFKEFMTTLSVASRGTPDEKLIWVFKIYDKDQNGYLLEKDVADILTSFYKLRNVEAAHEKAVKTARAILEKSDDNKDGKLSEAEFIHHVKDCPEMKDMLQSL